MKTPIALCIVLASTLAGCGQAAETRWGSPEPQSTTAAALNAVQQCTSQAQTCAQAASTPQDIAACEQALQSCLSALVAEAGVPSLPPFDAGLPPLPNLDAGVPLPTLPDGAVPPLPSLDAGLPQLPGLPDASAVDGCLQTLQSCLTGGTDPTTCATQVTTCLQAAL
jgi:hypothetical protein